MVKKLLEESSETTFAYVGERRLRFVTKLLSAFLLVMPLSMTIFAGTPRGLKLKRPILRKSSFSKVSKRKSLPSFPCKLKVSSVFRQPSGEMERYVEKTARTVDWNKKDLRCFFQWDSKSKGAVKSYICQVSLFPYSKTDSDWRNPPGLVYKKRFLGNSNTFSIDFRRFAPNPLAITRHFLNRNNLIRIERAIRAAEKKLISVPKGRKKQRVSAKALRAKTAVAIKSNKRQPFIVSRKLQLKKSSPLSRLKTRGPPIKGRDALPQTRRDYYVRVIPLNGSGRNVSAPSNTIGIDYGEPKLGAAVNWHGTGQPDRLKVPINNPQMVVKAYEPIRWPTTECQYWFKVWKEPTGIFKGMYKVGQELYINPYKKNRRKDFWDRVGDAISAAVNFIEKAVNWASKAYGSIKRKVATFVANQVPGVDADFVEGLIDAGLASMGIPPSLPDFDQLTSMGKDYLAQTLVDQSPVPVPPSVARDAMDKLVKEAEKSAAGAGSGLYSFIRLDPDKQRRAAHLILTLHNPTSQHTLAGGFMVEDRAKIYEQKFISFPSLRPGQKLDIPIFLTPNNDEWNLSKPHALNKDEWFKRYRGWPARFHIGQSFAVTPQYISRVLGIPYDKRPFDLVLKNQSTASFQHDADSSYRR